MIFVLTVKETTISPRFDKTNEILIAETDKGQLIKKPKTILINRTSSEEMCEIIVKENADTLICGGIEERYYKYLNWKKVTVIESVIGSTDQVLKMAMENTLSPGAILSTS